MTRARSGKLEVITVLKANLRFVMSLPLFLATVVVYLTKKAAKTLGLDHPLGSKLVTT